MTRMTRRAGRWVPLAVAALIAAGIAVAGHLVGRGFERGRSDRPAVTVKGLAERLVEADLAVWPLRITATGDDLGQVQAKIDADLEKILAFLGERGIAAAAIQPQRVEVTDLLAQAYRPEGAGQSRYIVAQTIVVRTERVDLVAELAQQTGVLVRQGIVLQETGGPAYLFTRLNEIKPAMIAEATANARAVAEQFALDSGTVLAGIQKASQGLFQILPRDPVPTLSEQSQRDKQIRVVTTIEYRLAD